MDIKPLKIYLGDLTYDTVSLSTEVFPLNVGYIGSYCKSHFGNLVDITLFKYIEDIDKAINNNPPDILGLSNYAWCQRVDVEIFRMLSKVNPFAVKVWGGPNFPLDPPSQKKFLNQYPEVDIYIPVEGEIGFVEIVKQALKSNSKEEIRNNVLSKPIFNCISRTLDDKLVYGDIINSRIKNLDEIPSPYSMGLLDKFFDGRLSPMLQTNRGCPFSCSFCVDGTDLVNKVNSFSMERVKQDIDYITKHVTENIHSLFISDLNFGMIPRDQEICDFISDYQEKFGFPKEIQATTGKNNKEKIIKNIQTVNGLKLCMSVQSMDQEILANVQRANISVEQALALAPAIKKSGLRTISEVILGLPGETYETHLDTLRQLLSAKSDNILVHNCMLLPGSEMNTPQERKKWGFESKFRILSKNFAKLSNDKNVFEIEEVVVGLNSLSFAEFLELRILDFMIFVTNMGANPGSGPYDGVLKFVREHNVDVFEIFYRMLKNQDSAPKNIRDVLKSVRETLINELWDSVEEIEAYYQDEKNYQKLLNGEAGINVFQFNNAWITTEYMEDWSDFILGTTLELLKEKVEFNETLEEQFSSIANYSRGISYSLLSKERGSTNPEYIFHYDILRWLHDPNDSALSNFKFSSPTRLSFRLTAEQLKTVQDSFDVFGDTKIGRGQVIKKIPIDILCRCPVIISKTKN